MITNDSQMTGAIGESLAAAAGYKPAPQLGSLPTQYIIGRIQDVNSYFCNSSILTILLTIA